MLTICGRGGNEAGSCCCSSSLRLLIFMMRRWSVVLLRLPVTIPFVMSAFDDIDVDVDGGNGAALPATTSADLLLFVFGRSDCSKRGTSDTDGENERAAHCEPLLGLGHLLNCPCLMLLTLLLAAQLGVVCLRAWEVRPSLACSCAVLLILYSYVSVMCTAMDKENYVRVHMSLRRYDTLSTYFRLVSRDQRIPAHR